MRPIVCATRGGEASRRTQERAIALAKERGAPLTFLCVVDPDFAGPVNEPLAAALKDELNRLATSLLSIAQARAQEQGVPAETAILSGPVWQTIEGYLREVSAGTLVIGAPGAAPTPEPFGSGDVQEFAERVRRDMGIEVVVVT